MPKILVLAEKPSVAREIARVLGCRSTRGGYIEGDRYIVTWALGHLVTLAEPEYYGEKYKTWSMDTLPMLPEKMELKVIPETEKQYSVVKNLLRSQDVSELVIATDAGREGELVARWILDKVGFRKPIKRLWISSQTDKAIKEGFSKLQPGQNYYNLYLSALSRAQADWLVGLNVTRALTCKYNAQLSAGRVQTPTLAMIVERENEIKRFVPKDYWNVQADLGDFFVTYCDSKNQTAIWEKQKADEIVTKIKGKEFKIVDVNVSMKVTPPPMLYDLTELQRDANTIHHMSAKDTLTAMQRLYENHKALTYPRTDSRYLTDDIVPTLIERIKAVSKGDMAIIAAEIIQKRQQIARVCVNNAKVSDHHAIIPTEQVANVTNMSVDEKRIYNLVVKRFLSCFYPNYEYKQIRAQLVCEGEHFYAQGRVVVNKGWKKVNDNRDQDEVVEQNLPGFKTGDKYICKSTQLKALKTTPPARYTEATLLTAMENPSKFITEQNMKEFIGAGLGTPATRADIIEKLFSSFYVEKRGNSLFPTSKGIQLIELVPPDLKEPLLTAKWEQKLEAIKNGKLQNANFVTEIKNYTTTLVKRVAESDTTYKHDNLTKNVCPVCGKYMLSVNGKKGKMLICEDRNCGERQNVRMETNARCPTCHKKLELFGDGEKQSFVCRCGFREKADTFRAKMQSSGANKKVVQEYMTSQKSEPQVKSAMALAMEKALNKEE